LQCLASPLVTPHVSHRVTAPHEPPFSWGVRRPSTTRAGREPPRRAAARSIPEVTHAPASADSLLSLSVRTATCVTPGRTRLSGLPGPPCAGSCSIRPGCYERRKRRLDER